MISLKIEFTEELEKAVCEQSKDEESSFHKKEKQII